MAEFRKQEVRKIALLSLVPVILGIAFGGGSSKKKGAPVAINVDGKEVSAQRSRMFNGYYNLARDSWGLDHEKATEVALNAVKTGVMLSKVEEMEMR